MPASPFSFRSLSLRFRLSVAAALLATAAVTAAAQIAAYDAGAALRRDVAASLGEIAYQMRDKLDRGMFERWREIRTLASMRSFREAGIEPAQQRSILDGLRGSFPAYAWIGFVGVDGIVRASTEGMLEGVDVSARDWFAAGLQGPFVGDLHEAKLLAKMLPPEGDEPLRFLDVAAPVFGWDGTLRGVLGAHLSWSWAAEVQASLLEPAAHRYELDVMILDAERTVLLGPSDLMGARLEPVAAGFDGERRYMTAVSVSTGYRDYPGLGWTVLVRQPEAEALATVTALRRRITESAAVIALLAAGLGWFGASLMTRPLRRLSEAAHRVVEDRNVAGVPLQQDYPEVAILSGTLDTLVRAEAAQRRSLEALNASLETRVRERTVELARINQALTHEIDERRLVEADRERLLEELRALAELDPLTGCLNRRGFEKLAARELARAARKPDYGISILAVDVDHFKRVNDTYGHAAGDLVLEMIGVQCRRLVRETDVVARFGGEEFVLLLTDSDEAAALAAAERLREAIGSASVPTVRGDLRVTVSIGVAQVGDGSDDLAGTMALADERLYAAKRAGRNRALGSG
ncbi:MAG: diguanylate cyclase [Alphaproteobacteria bacterium]